MQCNNITLFLLCVTIIQTAVLIQIYLTIWRRPSKLEWSSLDTVRLFNSYDGNSDGVIDVREFEAIKQSLDEAGRSPSLWSHENIDNEFDQLKESTGEILKVKAVFTPLVLDSMTKFNDGQDRSFENMEAFTGLKQWRTVFKNECELAVEHFETFLPKSKHVEVGESWTIIGDGIGVDLSSNRYAPPSVDGDHKIIHHILQMFHPSSFIYSRFRPQGAVACLRALNTEYQEIVFRVHAEYQLNNPPLFPFWFTPAQFSGRIVITRNGSHIHDFEMEVPNNQSLNVDMEWIYGRNEENKGDSKENDYNEGMNMEVDIGYLPEMRLFSDLPSYMVADNNVYHTNHAPPDVIWDAEISLTEAKDILEKKLYPFKEVPYYSFEQAYTKAKEEKKLVHSILLWGALHDQSC